MACSDWRALGFLYSGTLSKMNFIQFQLQSSPAIVCLLPVQFGSGGEGGAGGQRHKTSGNQKFQHPAIKHGKSGLTTSGARSSLIGFKYTSSVLTTREIVMRNDNWGLGRCTYMPSPSTSISASSLISISKTKNDLIKINKQNNRGAWIEREREREKSRKTVDVWF